MTTKNSAALDVAAVERTLRRMADEIIELNCGTDDLILVGIQRRGVQLADRLVKLIEERGTAVLMLDHRLSKRGGAEGEGDEEE